MNESNKIFEELKKLDKRIDKLSDPNNLGAVLWGEVGYYIKEAIAAIKKDKRIYGW
jgi:hypothetical protein